MYREYVHWVVTFFTVGFVFTQLHAYNDLHHQYLLKDTKARTYLQSDVCSDKMRHKLDSYNLCDESEMIVSVSPRARALIEVLSRWHVCAESRCSVLYYDFTDNILTITALVVAFVFVTPQFLRLYFMERHRNSLVETYMLPGYNKCKLV